MDLQRNLSLHFCNTFVDLTSDESMLGCSALLYSCDFYSSSSPGNSFFFFFFVKVIHLTVDRLAGYRIS